MESSGARSVFSPHMIPVECWLYVFWFVRLNTVFYTIVCLAILAGQNRRHVFYPTEPPFSFFSEVMKTSTPLIDNSRFPINSSAAQRDRVSLPVQINLKNLYIFLILIFNYSIFSEKR